MTDTYICTDPDWEIVAGPIDGNACWPSFVVRRKGSQPSLVYVIKGDLTCWRRGDSGHNPEAPFKIIKQEPYCYWIVDEDGDHYFYHDDLTQALAELKDGRVLFRARGVEAQKRGEIDYYEDGEWRRVGE